MEWSNLLSPKTVDLKMQENYELTVKNNEKIHEFYIDLLLSLYEKKESLSETGVKLVDFLKKIIEKGVNISNFQKEFQEILDEKFSQEEKSDPDFQALLLEWKNKIKTL